MDSLAGKRVLGVLAGGDLSIDILANLVRTADFTIAADGGANRLFAAGLRPHHILGDFDSIDPEHLQAGISAEFDANQDTSDCDKLLAFAAKQGASEIVLIGVEGDRPDHVLGILFSVARSSLNVRLAYRKGVGELIRPEQIWVRRALPATSISVMPLESCSGVSIEGVAWSLGNAELSMRTLVSLSNRVSDDTVTVTLKEGLLFAYLEAPTEPIWPLSRSTT